MISSGALGWCVKVSYPSLVIIKLSPTWALKLLTDTEPSTAKTIPGRSTVLSPVTNSGPSRKLKPVARPHRKGYSYPEL